MRLEAVIFSQLQPIIRVGEMRVVLMDNINVPAYKLHLQPKDSWAVAVVQENESNSVTIHGPNKSSAKEHVSIFVDYQSLEKPSPRWECRRFLLPQQRLPPNATGRNTAEESLVIKAKSCPV